MPDIKLGSLFDGIGVFPLAASRCGIRPVWASEIEKAPISITKRHFPDMVHLTVGDYVVLVSDGLLVDGPGWVAKQLELSAAAGEAPEKVAKTLVETARVRAQKTGRPDDITAAVLRLEKCV